MNNKILKSVIALLSLAPALATADILLHIDTLNDQFWFSGSATGNLYADTDYTRIRWDNSAGGFGDASAFAINDVFTLNGSEALSMDIDLFDTDDTIAILLSSGLETASGTLAANASTVYTYASAFGGLNASQEEAFESLIGQTIPLDQGTGFGGLTVVPEPSEAAAAFGLLALAGALLRRRMKTA